MMRTMLIFDVRFMVSVAREAHHDAVEFVHHLQDL